MFKGHQKPLYYAISSKERSSLSDRPSNCKINWQNPILAFKTITLKSFCVPATIYNIRSTNNTFLIDYASTSPVYTRTNQTVTIPVGQYSATALATTLQTLLNALPSTPSVTVSYSATTFKFSFLFNDATPTATFHFTPTTTPSSQLGFLNADYSIDGTTHILTSANVVQLDYPKYIYLSIPTLSAPRNFWNSPTTAFNAARPDFVFALTESNGSLVYNSADVYDIQHLCLSSEQSFSTGQIVKFMWFDLNGNEVDFNGADWQLQLVFGFGCQCAKSQ